MSNKRKSAGNNINLPQQKKAYGYQGTFLNWGTKGHFYFGLTQQFFELV